MSLSSPPPPAFRVSNHRALWWMSALSSLVLQAWDAGLKWWTYEPPGGNGKSMMPPCRRVTEQAAADRSKGGWLWAHLDAQQGRR